MDGHVENRQLVFSPAREHSGACHPSLKARGGPRQATGGARRRRARPQCCPPAQGSAVNRGRARSGHARAKKDNGADTRAKTDAPRFTPPARSTQPRRRYSRALAMYGAQRSRWYSCGMHRTRRHQTSSRWSTKRCGSHQLLSAFFFYDASDARKPKQQRSKARPQNFQGPKVPGKRASSMSPKVRRRYSVWKRRRNPRVLSSM